MTEGGVSIEEDYPDHYPTDSRMDNRRGTRQTSQEKLRSIFKELAGNSHIELRKDENFSVRQYTISGMPRHRRLEAFTYAIASGLHIIYVSEDNLVASSERPNTDAVEVPVSINENKEKHFEKFAGEPSIELNVVGDRQVRGYDLNDRTPDEQEIIRVNARVLGWQIQHDSNNMLIMRRSIKVENDK